MSSAPSHSLPIAVFDSGVGGLTVLHELLVSLPAEDYLYLGDTARFPYGIKSPEELRARVGEVATFLCERGAKLLIVACNSATAAARDVAAEIASEAGIDTLSVIGPEAEIAAAITTNGRVGLLATPATVAAGAYHRALEGQGRGLEVTEVAAAELAPMIQRGSQFDESVVETARSYCRPLREAGVDTVILGCTHYPLVAPMLQRILGRDVRLVTAGHAVAAAAQRVLAGQGLEATSDAEGDYSFLCTAGVESFRELGTRFLQMPLGPVEHVDIPVGAVRPESRV
jgi:glutamate racemase